MQYSKHREAETWHELGLMGDTLSYTDEEILTSQALGYVRTTVGKANPMDIAVLYSIVNKGEGVEVTAKDLINDHTRLASLFESGIIVRGKVNKKKVKCDGIHIERESNDYGRQRRLNYPYHIVQQLDKVNADYYEYIDVLSGFEVEGYSSYLSDEQRARVNEFEQFCKIKIPNVQGSYFHISKGTQIISSRYGKITWTGLCTRKSDEYCSTHGGDAERNAWVLSPDMKVLSENNYPISWTSDHLNIRYVKEGLIEYNKMLARTYTKHADYKTVLKQINKAVNRMFKRDVLLQTTEGRGRKFKWYDHTWRRVQEKRTQIMASNSKKRKLGDIVNGWIYSKGSVTESFGMEIVNYTWKPKDKLYTYDIMVSYGKTDRYSSTQISKLGMRFLNEQDAIEYIQQLNAISMPKNAQVCINRKVKNDAILFVAPVYEYKAVDVTSRMTVNATVEVETIPTPQECLSYIQSKGNKWIEMYEDKMSFSFGSYATLNLTEVSA